MKALTYTSYKENYELYTKIYGSIAVNSFQIKLVQKDIILLSKVSIIVYKTDNRASVENHKCIHFNLEAGTHSIDNFDTKIKAVIFQKRKDWEPPQIKYITLVIPENYAFMA